MPIRGTAVVLVVEDNEDARTITTDTLRHFGYEVVSAGSVAEAAQAISVRVPNVVVLDARLPDGDGLELARTWMSDGRMRGVPIVVLTAFSARQDLEAALLAGVDAFLVKPCAASVLAAQIEKVLSGRRPSQMMRAQRP
jgi:DNA-binding response OmpR family regulator